MPAFLWGDRARVKLRELWHAADHVDPIVVIMMWLPEEEWAGRVVEEAQVQKPWEACHKCVDEFLEVLDPVAVQRQSAQLRKVGEFRYLATV